VSDGEFALLDTLRKLEVETHQSHVRTDRCKLMQLLHPNFFEVGSSGAVYSRDSVLAEFSNHPPAYRVWSQDFRIESLSKRLTLLTYRSAHLADDGTLTRHTLRASLWQSTEQGWQLRFHQGTPMAAFKKQELSHQGAHMSRQIIFTPKAAKPPATYSQAVKAAGLIFVSGTAPHDPQTGALVGTTIQEQTRQCLKNVAAILESAGSSLDKVASVTVVLADEQDFQGMNEEWLKWFPSNPPARQGAKLPVKTPGLKISIAAIAEA
jgi:2-iminobutanoate/2-iminopropanoate deaminase